MKCNSSELPIRRPRFSIVVPTFDRPVQLARCLAGLASQDYPRECFEVIVVSDGPGSALGEILHQYYGQMQMRMATQEHAGPARARNTGAAEGIGEFLLFLDDDCAPDSDWLHQWDRHTRKYPNCLAGGGTCNALEDNLYSSASHVLVEYVRLYYTARRENRTPFLPANNLCVPAERFRALGGFSSAFALAAGEDRDLCDRWHARGWPVVHAEHALASHAHRLELVSFLRQHWTYGRGAFPLRRARRARNQFVGIEPVGFYLGLISYPWKHCTPARAMLLSALMCLSQVATAAGYFDEWRRQPKTGERTNATRVSRVRG